MFKFFKAALMTLLSAGAVLAQQPRPNPHVLTDRFYSSGSASISQGAQLKVCGTQVDGQVGSNVVLAFLDAGTSTILAGVLIALNPGEGVCLIAPSNSFPIPSQGDVIGIVVPAASIQGPTTPTTGLVIQSGIPNQNAVVIKGGTIVQTSGPGGGCIVASLQITQDNTRPPYISLNQIVATPGPPPSLLIGESPRRAPHKLYLARRK